MTAHPVFQDDEPPFVRQMMAQCLERTGFNEQAALAMFLSRLQAEQPAFFEGKAQELMLAAIESALREGQGQKRS